MPTFFTKQCFLRVHAKQSKEWRTGLISVGANKAEKLGQRGAADEWALETLV
jgi:hypothetical protein